MTPNYCTSLLEITFLFQKLENICQKEKQCFGQKCLLFTGGASQARGTFFLPGFQKFSCPEVRSMVYHFQVLSVQSLKKKKVASF